MSSLSPKDRLSLCLFTFSDGRRCRTPRTGNHPHFCFCHAQKEARAQAAEKLGKDLAYFFSGDYLSACDLSTALSRLIPAVVRGDIKPRLARTVAYLVQTLMQTIHISQDEYINAFSSDGWRRAVRASVNGNRDYLFPPYPEVEQPEPEPTESHSVRPETQPSTPTPAPQPSAPQTATPLPRAGSPTNQPSAPPVPQAPPSPPKSSSSENHESAQKCELNNSPTTTQQPHPSAPDRAPYDVHFDHNYRLRESPKLS